MLKYPKEGVNRHNNLVLKASILVAYGLDRGSQRVYRRSYDCTKFIVDDDEDEGRNSCFKIAHQFRHEENFSSKGVLH